MPFVYNQIKSVALNLTGEALPSKALPLTDTVGLRVFLWGKEVDGCAESETK